MRAGVAAGAIFIRASVATKKGSVPAITRPTSPSRFRVMWASRQRRISAPASSPAMITPSAQPASPAPSAAR